ncbi:hypothetical protein D3C75_1009780 [compost metagenome]
MRHRCRPGIKFFLVRGIAGTQAFSHTVGAHRAPLIVIALQPDIVHVLKTTVFGNLLRWRMAVIVENRLTRCIVVIQAAGKFTV